MDFRNNSLLQIVSECLICYHICSMAGKLTRLSCLKKTRLLSFASGTIGTLPVWKWMKLVYNIALYNLQKYNLSISYHKVLYKVAEKVKNFATIYLVDITQVSDFNKMYELYDPCTTMFFYRNKHIMIDLGTGNNNKINWALEDTQEFIDIVETIYRGARKGNYILSSIICYKTSMICD